MKESVRTTSKTLNLEADRGVFWEDKLLVSDVDRSEKEVAHREEGKTRFGYVVCNIYHE
jgi:hypothetical protein